MGARRVLRYEVPVDGEWHRLEITGSIEQVGCRVPNVVEFWTVPNVQVRRAHDGMGKLRSETFHDIDEQPRGMEYRVFATGEPIAAGLYVGTTYAGDAVELVWHLFERGAPISSDGTR